MYSYSIKNNTIILHAEKTESAAKLKRNCLFAYCYIPTVVTITILLLPLEEYYKL